MILCRIATTIEGNSNKEGAGSVNAAAVDGRSHSLLASWAGG